MWVGRGEINSHNSPNSQTPDPEGEEIDRLAEADAD
jgi:hypothetical protein